LQSQQVVESAAQCLPSSLPETLSDDPELAAIVEAWSEWPDALRAGSVAMVKAATKGA